ncbi:hypothetical protein GCM10011494_18260 [Novosphingobium endophyticum]|uniref:Uncharacterized protein n=1 Tax=Novosphingobium endophyticum TaxID=1955250 RepID=A0A916X5F8_9SPHN|nr:hypothetical protein [Novosphingobium endophyticum]GGC00084.1 hypothetical protein GCM10011494_18260 [Novosphingobium endophyticum]
MRDGSDNRPRPLVTIYGSFAVGTLIVAACFGFATESEVIPGLTDTRSKAPEESRPASGSEPARMEGMPPTQQFFGAEAPEEFTEAGPREAEIRAGSPVEFEANGVPPSSAMPQGMIPPEAAPPQPEGVILP